MKKFFLYLFSLAYIIAAAPAAWAKDQGASVAITPPIKSGANLQTIVATALNATLGLIGIIALVAFIWGGFTWMISNGDASKIAKAKKIMIWAIAGLVVIFASYGILVIIFKALGYPATGTAVK